MVGAVVKTTSWEVVGGHRRRTGWKRPREKSFVGPGGECRGNDLVGEHRRMSTGG